MTDDPAAAGAPVTLFRSLSGLSDRKLRLLAVACCRRAWDSLSRDRYRQAVERAERYADGHLLESARESDWLRAHVALNSRTCGPADRAAVAALGGRITLLSSLTQGEAAKAAARSGPDPANRWARVRAERAWQARLVRDVAGEPVRPPAFNARWRTADVTALARGIYEDRAFDRLPRLSDALMDAGCGDETVISHCRADGPHVRGCWVVDLVLGKG